ncbi:MAG: hypothetical protein C4527_03570 [Candidatus Omnitrophota bacterium]|jgi:hypothetical protein|nr:MAG: hypothetical protein C4527_03570 [Candidatus Omnitrophota bacterium]
MNLKTECKVLLEDVFDENLKRNDNLSLQDRRSFMSLTIEERRKVLEKQSKELAKQYNTNKDWTETQGGDFIEY